MTTDPDIDRIERLMRAGRLRLVERGAPITVNGRELIPCTFEEVDLPLECTGLAASWCPIHGDCTCPRHEDGLYEGHQSHTDCPLHGWTSDHAERR